MIVSVDGHAGEYAADFVKSVLETTIDKKLRSILCSPSGTTKEELCQAIEDAFSLVDSMLCHSIFHLLPVSFYQQGTWFTGRQRQASRHNVEKHFKVVVSSDNEI